MALDKPEDNNKIGKAGKRIGMTLAAGLAAGTAHGQEFDGGGYPDYESNYGYTDSYESYASEEALKAIDELMEAFGPNLSVSHEQLGIIHSTIDKFVAEHPPKIGQTVPTEKGPATDSSYDPYGDMQQALNQRSDEMNPLLLGLTWKELNKRMKEYFKQRAE